MEILIAIIGALIGIGGIMGGLLKSKSSENKILKQQNKKINDVNTTNEKITDVINTNRVEKKSVAKKNGALFSILIFILFSLYGCAGMQYEPVAPNIVILQYKLETVKYDYDNKSDLFTFTHEDMNNLIYNIDVMKDVINKYENQIILYNEWRKQ